MDNIFSDNPKVDLYYKTSDSTAFFSKNSAQNHAKTLDDKSVQLVTKSSVEKEEPKAEKGETVKNTTDMVVKVDKLSPSADSLKAEMVKTTPDEVKTKVQEIVEKGAETQTEQTEKLTPKQQLQADYQVKFGEIPEEKFTKQQLSEAIEKGEKLVAELNID